MSEVVEADVLLAIVIKERGSISFKELRGIRNDIEGRNRDIIVSISGPAIQLALYYYPQLFEEKNGGIHKAEGSELFFNSDYIDNVFLSTLSAGAKKTLADIKAKATP